MLQPSISGLLRRFTAVSYTLSFTDAERTRTAESSIDPRRPIWSSSGSNLHVDKSCTAFLSRQMRIVFYLTISSNKPPSACGNRAATLTSTSSIHQQYSSSRCSSLVRDSATRESGKKGGLKLPRTVFLPPLTDCKGQAPNLTKKPSCWMRDL